MIDSCKVLKPCAVTRGNRAYLKLNREKNCAPAWIYTSVNTKGHILSKQKLGARSYSPINLSVFVHCSLKIITQSGKKDDPTPFSINSFFRDSVWVKRNCA